jgi:HEAT repeat
MDFSSATRALQSLDRRRPPVPTEVVSVSKELLMWRDGNLSEEDYIKGVSTILHSDDGDRWEGLAVGLLLSTEMLVQAAAANQRAMKAVYIEGPRVPQEKVEETKSAGNYRALTQAQLSQVASWLHAASLKHLEHNEPRVRTFVARAVGAHATWSVGLSESDENYAKHVTEREAIHSKIVASIQDHIQQGRDHPENYSKSSTGALDDTTGWRALETNWQCLACWIASLGANYFRVDGLELDSLLANVEHSAVTHVNRHVRAAAIAVLEQLVVAAGNDKEHWPQLETGALRATVVKVLKTGLADNWSQVRMAASVLNRVLWTTLQEVCKVSDENLQQLYPVLIPRMCLNRFYLAQGVKLYSHQTWKQIFPESGVSVVAQSIASVVRYYVQMCDADNHVVREGACQAVAELAVKIGMDETYAAVLQPHVPVLLQALLMCFHDESWPVRDEACLACGTFCRAYPEECRSSLETLWTRWSEQLTDQIWSCRSRAAVALGQACQAYGEDFFERLMKFIEENLPAALNQPKMSTEEHKALQNNLDAHSNLQLYSCGSLAPKLKKKAGAGRIGCSNCDVDRPRQPWEVTDGCLYLIRELVETSSQPDSTIPPMSDNQLLPLLQKVADVCRVSHFPQSDDLRSTLWRNLPGMMEAVGKQRCKTLYLDIFIDPLMRNLDSRSASAISIHAAGTCAYELSRLVGPNIFRGRVYDEYQRETLDRVIRDRELEEQNAPPELHQKQFSPFEPPGLLDNLDNPFSHKMSPGLPAEMLNHHPGTDDTMSM